MNTRRTGARTFVCDCFAVTGILPLLPSLPRLRHIPQCNPAKVSRSFTGKTFRELSSWIRFRLYQMLCSLPRTCTHSCIILIHDPASPRSEAESLCPDATARITVSAEGQVRGTSFGKRIGAFSWPSSALQSGRKLPI